jgi:hypothetical protein
MLFPAEHETEKVVSLEFLLLSWSPKAKLCNRKLSQEMEKSGSQQYHLNFGIKQAQ